MFKFWLQQFTHDCEDLTAFMYVIERLDRSGNVAERPRTFPNVYTRSKVFESASGRSLARSRAFLHDRARIKPQIQLNYRSNAKLYFCESLYMTRREGHHKQRQIGTEQVDLVVRCVGRNLDIARRKERLRCWGEGKDDDQMQEERSEG